MGRFAESAEVANAALWLASDLGLTTTGEVVHVDSGYSILGI